MDQAHTQVLKIQDWRKGIVAGPDHVEDASLLLSHVCVHVSFIKKEKRFKLRK